jgi:hypothetical protein
MTRIGTWNLQNLFRPGGGSGSPGDEDAYSAKLDALARTISGLEPDVLAIQEVGDPAALQDLVARLPGNWHTRWQIPTVEASAWESCCVGC